MLVSEIIAGAQALLNDVSGDIYTSTSLLPFVRKAWRELFETYLENDLPFPHKSYTETIEVGDVAFDALPADLVSPVKLFERAVGQTDDDWVPMTERTWSPNQVKESNLIFWDWRQGIINFLGANTDREVKMQYEGNFSTLTASPDSTIPILNAQTFLEARVAAIAAMVIGANKERAIPLADDAKDALNRLITAGVKQRQNQPVRRRGYPSRRR